MKIEEESDATMEARGRKATQYGLSNEDTLQKSWSRTPGWNTTMMLSFGPVKSTSDFWPPELQQNKLF